MTILLMFPMVQQDSISRKDQSQTEQMALIMSLTHPGTI